MLRAPRMADRQDRDPSDVRFFTIADFEDFCREKGVRVHKQIALDTESSKEVFDDPNLNADLAIFVISRAQAPVEK